MNCELKILDSFLFYEIIDMIQINPNLQTPQNIFFYQESWMVEKIIYTEVILIF